MTSTERFRWKEEDVIFLDAEEVHALAGRPETALHQAADALQPALEKALSRAFGAAGTALGRVRPEATAAYMTALAISTIRLELKESLAKVLRKVFVAGGETGAKLLSQLRTAELRTAKRTFTPKFDFTFDDKRQAAIDWADKHAAELIDGISETSRELINNAIAELLETGDWKAARAEILEVVGDKDRVNRIVRNETMTAVHAGQREVWEQAVEEGVLNGDEEREWIVVGDERVCPICEGLEGKRAKLGESYIGEDGEEYDGPPAHVSCRCSEGISG
jgi:hypothetical protein